MQDLVGFLRVGSLPTMYLDLTLGSPYKAMTVWDGVVERF